MKSKCVVKANSKSGVALIPTPYSLIRDVTMYVRNGTIVTVDTEDIFYDFFGDHKYISITIESGEKGYILEEALEMVK